MWLVLCYSTCSRRVLFDWLVQKDFIVNRRRHGLSAQLNIGTGMASSGQRTVLIRAWQRAVDALR